MLTINIHEAKTHLSRLVDQAANGEPFIIAKAGKPLVKVTALSAPVASEVRRVGFLAGQIAVPDDSIKWEVKRSKSCLGERMKLLLDTHILLWAAGQLPQLPAVARSLLEDTSNEVMFSSASLWGNPPIFRAR